MCVQVYFCIEKVILLSLAFLVPCYDLFTTEWCDIPNLVRYTLKEKQVMVSVTRIKLEHEISFFQDRKRACHSNLSFKFLYGLSWFQISIKTHYLSLVHHLPYFANFSTKHVLWTSFFLKNIPWKQPQRTHQRQVKVLSPNIFGIISDLFLRLII